MQSDIKTIENYSTDQFDLDLKKWTTAPQAYYALAKEPPQDTITRLLSNTCDDVKQRIGAVKESDDYKSALAAAFLNPTDENSMAWINEFNSAKIVPENNQCLNSDKYDQYSTPSRDRRLFDGLMLARAYFTETLRLKGSKSISIAKLAQFKKIFTHPELSAEAEIASENKNSGISAQSICSLNVGTVDGKNITLDLAEIKRRFFKSYVSPNPNEDLLGRWGGKNHNRGELAKSCPTYGEEYPPYDLNGAEHKANAEAKAALE